MRKKYFGFVIILTALFNLSALYVSAAAKEYKVNIAILCEDLKKGQEFIDKMCFEKSVLVPADMSVEFTGEKNSRENYTELYVGFIDTNYHIKFHLCDSVDHHILKKCSGAVILYDIADKTFDRIVSSAAYNERNLKTLMLSENPLTRYISKLQYSIYFWGFQIYGWYNAINFVTYGKDNLPDSVYQMRHEKINSFTCALEHYLNVDNKWGRGNQDISTDDSWKKTLFWISGEARRSISDGSVNYKYYTIKPSSVSDKDSKRDVKMIKSTNKIIDEDTLEKKSIELQINEDRPDD